MWEVTSGEQPYDARELVCVSSINKGILAKTARAETEHLDDELIALPFWYSRIQRPTIPSVGWGFCGLFYVL